MFKRRRFPVEIILFCVRWYCKLCGLWNSFALSSAPADPGATRFCVLGSQDRVLTFLSTNPVSPIFTSRLGHTSFLRHKRGEM
jgi:hypothetical protein